MAFQDPFPGSTGCSQVLPHRSIHPSSSNDWWISDNCPLYFDMQLTWILTLYPSSCNMTLASHFLGPIWWEGKSSTLGTNSSSLFWGWDGSYRIAEIETPLLIKQDDLEATLKEEVKADNLLTAVNMSHFLQWLLTSWLVCHQTCLKVYGTKTRGETRLTEGNQFELVHRSGICHRGRDDFNIS